MTLASAEPVQVIEEPKEEETPKTEPEKKKKKKIVKKKSDDLDEITKRLLDQDIERTELEQYEKVDVDLQKKPKLAAQIGDVSQKVETFEETTEIEAPVIVEEYTTERRASEIQETAEKLPSQETKKLKKKKSLKKPDEETTDETVEEIQPLIEEEPEEEQVKPEEDITEAKVEEVTPKVDKPKRRRSIKKPDVESLPEETKEVEEKVPEVEETPQEPEVVESKKPKTKKVIKKKKTDDLDEITQRLLEQEIERPDLEQYEKVDVEIQKKEKPKVNYSFPMLISIIF